MKLGKLGEVYYSAGEARKTLGLDEDTFQYWGKSNRINRIYLPGRKHPVYSKAEINKLASQIEATLVAEQSRGLEFRKATLEDLPAEYELSYLIFGTRAHTVDTRAAYMERNADIDYHLYDRDKLVAFINIIPFDTDTIHEFMSGTKRGHQLTPEKVLPFEANKPLECIVMEIATTPLVPPGERAYYGAKLLMEFAGVFKEWAEKDIIISKLHATSATQTGIRLIKHAGFEETADLGKGRLAFELDIPTTDSKLLLEYKEILKKRAQERENTKQAQRIKKNQR